jgi:hypothetical protein
MDRVDLPPVEALQAVSTLKWPCVLICSETCQTNLLLGPEGLEILKIK